MVVAIAVAALVESNVAGASMFDDAQRIRAESHRATSRSGGDCYVRSLDYYRRLGKARIPARVVIVQSTMLNIYDSHSFVEVLKDGRWVIQDPTFNGGWRIDGRIVGTRELQAALRNGSWRTSRWHGPQKAIHDYYVDPRLLMRHARFRQWDAGGALRETRATVPGLHALYYAQKKRPHGATAGLVVVEGGNGGTANGYALAQLPDSRWISPIHFTRGSVSRTGGGTASVRWVPPYR
jgi:hypothetical protein